jgi:hypothetical protein
MRGVASPAAKEAVEGIGFHHVHVILKRHEPPAFAAGGKRRKTTPPGRTIGATNAERKPNLTAECPSVFLRLPSTAVPKIERDARDGVGASAHIGRDWLG